jgi:hypothetical protein
VLTSCASVCSASVHSETLYCPALPCPALPYELACRHPYRSSQRRRWTALHWSCSPLKMKGKAVRCFASCLHVLEARVHLYACSSLLLSVSVSFSFIPRRYCPLPVSLLILILLLILLLLLYYYCYYCCLPVSLSPCPVQAPLQLRRGYPAAVH